MSDIDAKVAALKTEVTYLKWIIPAACGFIALLILIFWNIERNRIGERVRIALDEEGVNAAISETKKARDRAVADADAVTKIKDALPWKEIEVLSIDHEQPVLGKYFNFNNSDVDAVLGNEKWDNTNHLIINGRTGKIGAAVLWRNPNKGSIGDGHGRWVENPIAEQWQVGDKFIIVYVPNK